MLINKNKIKYHEAQINEESQIEDTNFKSVKRLTKKGIASGLIL